MKATEILSEEHEGVKLMLQILESISLKLEKKEKVDVNDLWKIIEFLTIFVDKCHHAKEENLLFPMLLKKGVPKEEGLIIGILEEHNLGRNYIRNLKEAIAQYEKEDPESAEKIKDNAGKYVKLLKDHIKKEEEFFTEVDKYLETKDQDKLLSEFERVEKEEIGEGKHEEFHALLDRLQKIYLT